MEDTAEGDGPKTTGLTDSRPAVLAKKEAEETPLTRLWSVMEKVHERPDLSESDRRIVRLTEELIVEQLLQLGDRFDNQTGEKLSFDRYLSVHTPYTLASGERAIRINLTGNFRDGEKTLRSSEELRIAYLKAFGVIPESGTIEDILEVAALKIQLETKRIDKVKLLGDTIGSARIENIPTNMGEVELETDTHAKHLDMEIGGPSVVRNMIEQARQYPKKNNTN